MWGSARAGLGARWPTSVGSGTAAVTIATTEQTGTGIGALEALYEEYHRQALGLALRVLGNLGEAEEVVQEAFLAVWRSGHTYDPARGSTRTWILTLVRNRAIDVVRARQRRPVQPLDETFDPPDSADVPLQAALNVDAARVAEALYMLPPEQRAVIELAYSSGLSHTEIAARLSVPVGTVKGRIRLGLDRLRQALGVPR
jgi:RNA polymerase sigma-70 factor (ECF subfamily)